jgi:hypothetical protein
MHTCEPVAHSNKGLLCRIAGFLGRGLFDAICLGLTEQSGREILSLSFCRESCPGQTSCVESGERVQNPMQRTLWSWLSPVCVPSFY